MSTISNAVIRYYRDNQMYQAIIEWQDRNGTPLARTTETICRKNSCFLMRPSSMEMSEHMRQLFARAERDGVQYKKEIW